MTPKQIEAGGGGTSIIFHLILAEKSGNKNDHDPNAPGAWSSDVGSHLLLSPGAYFVSSITERGSSALFPKLPLRHHFLAYGKSPDLIW